MDTLHPSVDIRLGVGVKFDLHYIHTVLATPLHSPLASSHLCRGWHVKVRGAARAARRARHLERIHRVIEGGGTKSVLNIPSSALWDSLRAGTASLQSTAPQLSHRSAARRVSFTRKLLVPPRSVSANFFFFFKLSWLLLLYQNGLMRARRWVVSSLLLLLLWCARVKKCWLL